MKVYFVFCMVLAVCIVCGPAYGQSRQQVLMDKLINSDDSSFGGLADVSSNRPFFEHTIDRDVLDAVKQVVGEELYVRLHLDFEEGKSVSEFIEANQSVLKDHPYILAAVAHDITKEDGVSLSDNDSDSDGNTDDGQSDDSGTFPEPARTISAGDLYEYAQGPEASPRTFREFLARNYGLSNKPPADRPDQIEAFSVFFNYASSVSGVTENSSDYEQLLTDRFVRDSGTDSSVSRPSAGDKGLFLPSAATLTRMEELLTINKELEFARSTGHIPDFSSVSSEALQEFLRAAGVSDVSQLEDMSADALRENMSQLIRDTVKDELEKNDYVAEVSSVAVGSDNNNGGTSSGNGTTGSLGVVNPSFVVGNNEATNETNTVYSEALGPLSESQRTMLEIENGGLFHINGNPQDVKNGGKLYHFLGTPDISDGYLSLMERPRESTDE